MAILSVLPTLIIFGFGGIIGLSFIISLVFYIINKDKLKTNPSPEIEKKMKISKTVMIISGVFIALMILLIIIAVLGIALFKSSPTVRVPSIN